VAKEELVEEVGGGFVAETLATSAIIVNTTTNKIATRAELSNSDNFGIPFVMADPSSSTTLYKYWCEQEGANHCEPMLVSAVHTTLARDD
jgi:hypothetical protein